MRELKFSSRFQKDVKLCLKQGRDMEKLSAVLKLLQSGEELPARYKDHPLRHNWKGYRDLHIEPDWVLIYKVMGDEVVLLAATGTHAHIF